MSQADRLRTTIMLTCVHSNPSFLKPLALLVFFVVLCFFDQLHSPFISCLDHLSALLRYKLYPFINMIIIIVIIIGIRNSSTQSFCVFFVAYTIISKNRLLFLLPFNIKVFSPSPLLFAFHCTSLCLRHLR